MLIFLKVHEKYSIKTCKKVFSSVLYAVIERLMGWGGREKERKGKKESALQFLIFRKVITVKITFLYARELLCSC